MASLHPHTPPPPLTLNVAQSFLLEYSMHVCVCSACICVYVCGSHLSPSCIPLLVTPPPLHSLSPSHLVLISFFFSLPLALSHKNKHMHPSIHPHTQLARERTRLAARSLVRGYAKKFKKLVPYHCLMVSPWQLREQGLAIECQTNTGF